MDCRFSVLITVYNCGKYVDECIQSVLGQTYQPFEIILVDDGSKDNSGEICDLYAIKDSRIKVLHQERQGVIRARQKALTFVTGDYFIFLDSDDFWDLQLLQVLNEEIVHYHTDVGFFRLNNVNNDGTFISQHKSVFDDEAIIDHNHSNQIFDIMLDSSELNNLVCKVVKSSLIQDMDYSFFSEVEHAEDLLQSLPYIYHAENIIYIDRALYNYRNVPNSITKSASKRFIKDISVVRNELLKYVKMLGMDTERNLVRFYRYYLISVLNHFNKIVSYGYTDQELTDVFEELKDIQLLKDAIGNRKKLKIPLHLQVSLFIYRKGKFKALIQYERLLSVLKKVTKKLIRSR